jgi:S1-C subfamily serine protease
LDLESFGAMPPGLIEEDDRVRAWGNFGCDFVEMELHGDIVVAADGAPIRGAARLRNKIGLTPVGERVQLTVQRKGVARTVSVEVAPASETTRTMYSSLPRAE